MRNTLLLSLAACGVGPSIRADVDILEPGFPMFDSGGTPGCDGPVSESPWGSSTWEALTAGCAWTSTCPEGAYASATVAVDEDESIDQVFVGSDGRVVAHHDRNDTDTFLCEGVARYERWFGPIVDDCPVAWRANAACAVPSAGLTAVSDDTPPAASQTGGAGSFSSVDDDVCHRTWTCGVSVGTVHVVYTPKLPASGDHVDAYGPDGDHVGGGVLNVEEGVVDTVAVGLSAEDAAALTTCLAEEGIPSAGCRTAWSP